MAVTPGSQWSGAGLTNPSPELLPASTHRPPSFQPQWLVRWRWRREQPEHLRHLGAGLVHEDRISRGLLRSEGCCRPHRCPATSHTTRPISFKPLVQTVSTSLVYRFNWSGAPVAGAVLISAKSAVQKPRHCPGLFCVCREPCHASGSCPARALPVSPCASATSFNDATRAAVVRHSTSRTAPVQTGSKPRKSACRGQRLAPIPATTRAQARRRTVPPVHDGPLKWRCDGFRALRSGPALYSIGSYGRCGQWFPAAAV